MKTISKKNTLLAVSPFLLAACGSAGQANDSTQPVDRESANIIKGTASTDQPGIGSLNNGGCTATLISSRVILTAAHCVGFDKTHSGLSDGSSPPSFPGPSGHTFTIFPSDGSAPVPYNVLRFSVASNAYGADDLMVGELDSDVPPELATPLAVASNEPNNGDAVTSWGYGCTDGQIAADKNGNYYFNKTVYPAAGTKTTRSSTWNAGGHTTNDNLNCPGDSGGPILDSSGAVIAVHSTGAGSNNAPGNDDNARVVNDRAWIAELRALYGNHDVCDACAWRVAFRTSDGHYLQANYGGGADINATPTEVGTWETFRMVGMGDHWFAFQADNGQFVSAEGGGGAGLTADRDRVGPWETFQMDFGEGFNVTLKSKDPSKFVCADNGGGGNVTVDRDEAAEWETFSLSYH